MVEIGKPDVNKDAVFSPAQRHAEQAPPIALFDRRGHCDRHAEDNQPPIQAFRLGDFQQAGPEVVQRPADREIGIKPVVAGKMDLSTGDLDFLDVDPVIV